jgi:hypothetical protein
MQDDRRRWLEERENLTLELTRNPYSSHVYLRRAICHEKLELTDLAASDGYRALLLTDEVRDEEGEYHLQAIDALETVTSGESESATNRGVRTLSRGTIHFPAGTNEDVSEREEDESDGRCWYNKIAQEHALQSYEILARTLSNCGDLRSAYDFTHRGLKAFPGTVGLHALQKGVIEKYAQTLIPKKYVRTYPDINPREDLPENGSARREIYPWNDHEPDRFSDETLMFINGDLQKSAPKCEVSVIELPVLDGDASYLKSQPTSNKQLGIFAISQIEPYERVLLEASVLTSSTRLHDPICDACSSRLPPSSQERPLPTCPDCEDVVFCSQDCLERARNVYHPAICGITDFDIVAKDPSPFAATSALYTLLVARTMAMAESQNIHPLDLPQIKYLWGDYSHSTHPAERTLPFSFSNNVAQPLHLLARLDKDPFAPEALSRYDTWIINTLLAKFRATANAKMNERTGMPEVVGVHWLWSLANHSCAPNVRWEWEKGAMGFVARGGEEVVRWGEDRGIEDGVERWGGGIGIGQEVLNHYCDVGLPVKERREWAMGALGGVCRCGRCMWEEDENRVEKQ